jgi:hypothetical protein
VVTLLSPDLPAATCDRRRRDGPGGQRDLGSPRYLTQLDRPRIESRRRPKHREVATRRDGGRPDVERVEELDRGINRQPLGDPSKIEADPSRQQEPAIGFVEVDPAPSAARMGGSGWRRPIVRQVGERGVVADLDELGLKGGIEQPVGGDRGVERDADHRHELGRDRDGAPGGGVDRSQLAVGAKSAEASLPLCEQVTNDRTGGIGCLGSQNDEIGSHRVVGPVPEACGHDGLTSHQIEVSAHPLRS